MYLFLRKARRFQAKAVSDLLYKEILTNLDFQFVQNFDEMIDNLVYPAFVRMFENRHLSMMNESEYQLDNTPSIKTFEHCLNDEPDCIVALSTINTLLNKVFRVFYVLNQDIRLPNNRTSTTRERNQGTVIANLNFLLDLHTTNYHDPKVASSLLRHDLEKLGRLIAPYQTLTLPDIMQLLGYTQGIESSQDDPNSENIELEFLTSLHSCDISRLKKMWFNYLDEISKHLEGIHF